MVEMDAFVLWRMRWKRHVWDMSLFHLFIGDMSESGQGSILEEVLLT